MIDSDNFFEAKTGTEVFHAAVSSWIAEPYRVIQHDSTLGSRVPEKS